MKKVLLGVTTGFVCFGIICMTRVAVKAASVTGSGTTSTGAISASCIQKNDGCNTCSRQPGSENRACTKMACVNASGAILTGQTETCLAWTNDLPTEPVACTMEYAPVCASIQVQCFAAPCPAVQQTFGNACSMNANPNATFLYTGECGSPAATGMIVGGDKDIHGCIGSAGYTWNASIQQCVRPWELTGSLPGSDTDAHGCIGSAGYVWNVMAQQCLRPRENPTSKMSVREKYQYWKVVALLKGGFDLRQFSPLQQKAHIQSDIDKIDLFLQTSRLEQYRLKRMQMLKMFLQVYNLSI